MEASATTDVDAIDELKPYRRELTSLWMLYRLKQH